jgi:hypothetical protein
MDTNDDEREREAQRIRAERIRRARDDRNAALGGSPPAEGTPEDQATAEPSSKSSDADPNYVDQIDRRMRELDKD